MQVLAECPSYSRAQRKSPRSRGPVLGVVSSEMVRAGRTSVIVLSGHRGCVSSLDSAHHHRGLTSLCRQPSPDILRCAQSLTAQLKDVATSCPSGGGSSMKRTIFQTYHQSIKRCTQGLSKLMRLSLPEDQDNAGSCCLLSISTYMQEISKSESIPYPPVEGT